MTLLNASIAYIMEHGHPDPDLIPPPDFVVEALAHDLTVGAAWAEDSLEAE
jgi:hypothetical protein